MSNQILVPSLGESVTEATVSKWLKQVGEKVDSDEPLVELETDKVNFEVPSPLTGTLASIKVKEGDTVSVGTLLGVVDESKSSAIESKKLDAEKEESTKENIVTKKTKKIKSPVKKKENVLTLSNENKQDNSNEALVLDTLAEESKEEDIEEKYIPPKTKEKLSPAVRKIVEENNIDISSIEGTGKSGRISKGDLINLMGNIPQPSKRKISHGPTERVKMSRLRLTIAKRLKEAQNNAAMLTTFNEVNMNDIMQMKDDYKEDFQKKYSVKLGFMSFFVKASVVALKNFPSVNAEIENDHITYKNYYNISIAIGTDRGLVVPVLKKADELSFADIERIFFYFQKKQDQERLQLMIYKVELLLLAMVEYMVQCFLLQF